ncbi:MAG: TonB-dependent receptor [Cruoricaptor ignavus]|nr:TonB-dependent receptor [Cruoricaptor ignavus]
MKLRKVSVGALFLTIPFSLVYGQQDSVKAEKKIEGVTIKGSTARKTEAAIMTEMRTAKQVVSAISAEQITKGVDRNAAQAIQRVPGVTIVDGRFIMIRGVAERYNNTLINGAVAPSTEVDRRTFSFDLIPSGVLDRMVILKTATADKPGDFAGGIIEIITNEESANFDKLDIGLGFRTNTTFKDYYQSKGSATDAFGFDYDYRTLPSNFPSTNAIKNNPASAQRASRLLFNNFNPRKETAFPDGGLGYTFGRRFRLGKANVSTVNAFNWSNSYESREQKTDAYFALNAGQTSPQHWEDYRDRIFQNETRISLLSNWVFRLNSKNTIKFKNLFNQIGENETVLREGHNFQQRQDQTYRNYLLGYRARSIYIGQLIGEHRFTNSQLDWVGGFNFLYENEPDLRRFRTLSNLTDPNSFYMIDPPSSNLFDTSRYFGTLDEIGGNFGINYSKSFKDSEDFTWLKLKAGLYGDYKQREFTSRYMSYTLPGFLSQARRDYLINQPLSTVFSRANVNAVDGWRLQEGTTPRDSYDAQNILGAGYVMADIPLGRFDINVGLRAEHNILKLQSTSETGQPIDVDNPVTSILPSGNIGYKITDRSQLRLGYSRTVNRPEFREIAPFLFYDFKFNVARDGNPNLKTATIDNFDLRYEIYPSRGEVINLGVFAKRFQNPIENVNRIVTENRMFSYGNADKALVYGAELEVRKSLANVFANIPILNRMSVNLNASYIFSEVDLGDKAVSQQRVRALQGQSPYIINAALNYESLKGFGANLVYNRFGNRIFAVSDDNFPSIYELSRDNLDLTFYKNISEKVTVKLGVQNLLDAPFRFYEDTNRDNKIERSIDKANYVVKRGTLINASVSIKL